MVLNSDCQGDLGMQLAITNRAPRVHMALYKQVSMLEFLGDTRLTTPKVMVFNNPKESGGSGVCLPC